MKYNPDIHHRRSIRLKGYDYSRAGLYFITICTQNRDCLFGKIEKSNMQLNDAGIMIEHQWQKLIYRFDNIKLHEFIVMPNHFHGIVESVGVPLVGTQNEEQRQTEQRQTKQQPTEQPQTTEQRPTVGVPLVGTQNAEQYQIKQQPTEQPQTMDQPQKGQPQGIAPTVGDVVGAFKSLSTNDFIRNVKQNNWRTFYKKLWQRNYFEHIIRNEKSYNQISEYIQTNPLKWQDDKYYI
jgi:REP element-mobilizing transposase RayT